MFFHIQSGFSYASMEITCGMKSLMQLVFGGKNCFCLTGFEGEKKEANQRTFAQPMIAHPAPSHPPFNEAGKNHMKLHAGKILLTNIVDVAVVLFFFGVRKSTLIKNSSRTICI